MVNILPYFTTKETTSIFNILIVIYQPLGVRSLYFTTRTLRSGLQFVFLEFLQRHRILSAKLLSQ